MFFRDGLEVKRESLGCPSWRMQMTKVQKITLSPSRDIPFNKLVLPTLNATTSFASFLRKETHG